MGARATVRCALEGCGCRARGRSSPYCSSYCANVADHDADAGACACGHARCATTRGGARPKRVSTSIGGSSGSSRRRPRARAAAPTLRRALAGRDRPALVVVGPQTRARGVVKAVGSLRVRCRPLARAEELDESLRGSVLGVVLVAAGGRETLQDLRTVQDRAPEAPVFAVIPDDPSSRSVRRLYEGGVSGVFEWPREKDLLARFLAEMLSLRIVRGRAERADTALARAVRTHLKLLLQLPTLLRVEARDGVVSVTGEVDSLALKREVERCVSAVPGVRSLDSTGIRVLPEPVPDAVIRRSLRRLLRGSGTLDERTLSFSVDAGRVTLKGTVKDRRELLHLADLATNLHGVRDVELRILVARRATVSDRAAVRRLAELVDDVFPGNELRVSFFRGVAVLTGSVQTLATKRAVERFLAEDIDVDRVVNKLDVVGGEGRR